MLINHFKQVRRKRIVLFFFFLSYSVFPQNFSLLDSINIPDNGKIFENGWFEQIHSKKIISYFWFAGEEEPTAEFIFFIYSNDNKEFTWYDLPLIFLNNNNTVISSAAIFENYLAILGPFYFYLLEEKEGKYSLKKKIKLKQYVDKIYFLDKNNILLASTYDYADDKTLWTPYAIWCYNTKKSKFTHHTTVDVGRGVNLCYFPFQNISVSSKFFAVSYLTKPEIQLYSKECKMIRKIKLPDFTFNTDSVFCKYLSDSALVGFRYFPKNKIKIINDYKLNQYPLINRISFLNDDTLMCVVNTSIENFKKERKIYFYSISRDFIIGSFSVKYNDYNNPRNFFLASNEVQFNDGIVSYVYDNFNNEENKLIHSLNLYIYSNYDFFEKNIPALYDFKGVEVNKSDFLRNNVYLLLPDMYYCATCFKAYKNKKVLILVEDRANNTTWRYTQKKYFQMLFPQGQILFFEKGQNRSIQQNTIIKIR